MFDIIYVTNIPAFYKINLLNRIAEKKTIFVIFIGNTSSERNSDFYIGDKHFEYIILNQITLWKKISLLSRIFFQNNYKQLIVGGWDYLWYWLFSFLSPKRKNSIIIESSIHESKTEGYRKFLKKLFLSKHAKAYVPGKSNSELVKKLGFKGQVVKTKGVGIFNILPQPPYIEKTQVKNFIYVGRLSPEKNLRSLILTFNEMPEINLNIIGFGPLECELKEIASNNIFFHGAVANSNMGKYYRSSDVFILPSLSETWGLVVEEALNNGLPVIVSDKVGCAEEIIDDTNGIVFKLSEPDGLKKALEKIQEIRYYNNLRRNISKLDFKKIEDEQVKCYL